MINQANEEIHQEIRRIVSISYTYKERWRALKPPNNTISNHHFKQFYYKYLNFIVQKADNNKKRFSCICNAKYIFAPNTPNDMYLTYILY